MKSNKNYPKTLIQAVRYFSDLDVAHQFFADAKWPDGCLCCPHCGSVEVKYLASYRRWECKEKHPKRQFTVKVGTIMEDSPMGLDKWAVAFWLEANAKNSISSYELHRALGITQKSAWFMLHRIRLALQSTDAPKLSGFVEADETYIGGKIANMSLSKRKQFDRRKSHAGKTIVAGVLARGGEVRASVVNGTTANDLHPVIHKNVQPGSLILSDAQQAYRTIKPTFGHEFVDHTVRYVDRHIHTNGLENFWSLFKRCIKGTHVSIEPAHLQAYLDSEIFRFNMRKLDDGQRMVHAVTGFNGKRLTYKALVGKEARPGKRGSGAENESPLN